MKSTITPEELREVIGDEKELRVIDVRRKADFDADTQMIQGAEYRDPEQLEQWSTELDEGQDVIIYCARGGSVSKSVSEKLLAKKMKVRFVEGGLAAWKELGGELQEKTQ